MTNLIYSELGIKVPMRNFYKYIGESPQSIYGNTVYNGFTRHAKVLFLGAKTNSMELSVEGRPLRN